MKNTGLMPFFSVASVRSGLLLLLSAFVLQPLAEASDARSQLRTTRSPDSRPIRPAVAPRLAAAADLVIGSMSWSLPVKAGDRVGKNSILNILVRNKGKGRTGKSRLSVTCRSLSGAGCPKGVDKHITVAPLAPGATTTLTWPDTSKDIWPAGRYRIAVIADSKKQVRELDEGNNQRSLDFTVGPKSAQRKKANLKKVVRQLNPVKKRAINPQPEPPGKAAKVKKAAASHPSSTKKLKAGKAPGSFAPTLKKGRIVKISSATKPDYQLTSMPNLQLVGEVKMEPETPRAGDTITFSVILRSSPSTAHDVTATGAIDYGVDLYYEVFDQVTPKEKKELRFEWTADSPGKHHVGFMCHLSYPHKDTVLEDNRKTLEFEVLPAQKKWGSILGFTDSAETSGMTASAIPMNPSRINGILYGKVGGKNVPQLANGCENVSVTFFNPDGTSMGSVSAFEGDGANCRYEYHTTGDVAGLRPGAWIKGHMSEWVYHEDPSHDTGSTGRTINGELKTVSPAITAQTLTPMIPGQCRGSRQEGRFSGKVDGKGPDQWFGCENIRVQWQDYNGNDIGTTQMFSDGSGQDCRYCFEFSKPNYLSFRLPFFIGDYDMEWKRMGRTKKEENGVKVVTDNTKLLAVRDLTGPQKPDLELRFMKIAEPGNLQSNIETKLEALDAADFIYQVTNRGVSRARPYKVVLAFGGIPIVTNEHPELGPGKTLKWQHAVWPHILCNAPVSLKVDPDNRVAETNENNNTWTYTLPCSSSNSPHDLRVVYLHQERVEQTRMTPVRFIYAITNEDRSDPATAGAPPSILSVRVYKYADHSLLGETSVNIPHIPLGTRYDGEIYAFVTARSDYVVLYVDPDNTIAEKRLDNNRIRLKAGHVTFVQ